MWIKPCLVLAGTALLVPVAPAAESLPNDVMVFIMRRDSCDHLRGEEAYDAERQAFLERELRQLCAGTDAQLQALKRKYGSVPVILERLEEYEPFIEPRGR